MIVILLGTVALVLGAVGGLAKVVLVGEMRGKLAGRCRRRVDRAAALLPPGLREDLADEWLAELAALEDGDRLVSAWRFARSLPAAAAEIAAALAPAPANGSSKALGWTASRGVADRLKRLDGEWKMRWRAVLRQLRNALKRPGLAVTTLVKGASAAVYSVRISVRDVAAVFSKGFREVFFVALRQGVADVSEAIRVLIRTVRFK